MKAMRAQKTPMKAKKAAMRLMKALTAKKKPMKAKKTMSAMKAVKAMKAMKVKKAIMITARIVTAKKKPASKKERRGGLYLPEPTKIKAPDPQPGDVVNGNQYVIWVDPSGAIVQEGWYEAPKDAENIANIWGF